MKVFICVLASFFVFSSLVPQISSAQEENQNLLKRVVVFPISSNDTDKVLNDKIWWNIRDIISDDRRFLVASKKFMVQQEVFQPRENLKPADAILLGRLLDTHAHIVTQLKNKVLKMEVLSGFDGLPIWSQEWPLQASAPVSDQILSASEKLTKMFLASVPYQGFHLLDPLIGEPLFENGDQVFAKVDLGTNSQAKIGDSVLWVELARVSSEPLFQAGGKLTVIGEGLITAKENDIYTVQVVRVKELKGLISKTLIRVPSEVERLQKENLPAGSVDRFIPELSSSALKPAKNPSHESRPLMMALSSIANLVALLLLAL